jgi:hypothetical protein
MTIEKKPSTTAQRNENSVLFSLASLTATAPAAKLEAPESSGTIDLKAHIAPKARTSAVDPHGLFGASPLQPVPAEVAVAPRRASRSWLIPLFAGAGVAALIVGLGLGFGLRHGGGVAHAAQSTAQTTSTTAPEAVFQDAPVATPVDQAAQPAVATTSSSANVPVAHVTPAVSTTPVKTPTPPVTVDKPTPPKPTGNGCKPDDLACAIRYANSHH